MAARWGVEGVKLTVSIVLQAADKACRGDNRQVVVYVGCFAKLMRFHKEWIKYVVFWIIVVCAFPGLPMPL